MNDAASVLYLSHGGGPLPLLGDPGHRELVRFLTGVAASFPKPEFIIVVSAHWEATRPTIVAGSSPPLVYDYYGFPGAAYEIRYPAPGFPELAAEMASLLSLFDPRLDESRGFDHGVFVPLKLMYPEADIPCVQLSLVHGLDPERHLALGRALSGLKDRNALLIGSGFSFHNLREFFSPVSAESRAANEAFEGWLIETCGSEGLSAAEREDRLIHWERAPGARHCHPREEHLLPLHVCCGFANRAADRVYELEIMRRKSSAYLWGGGSRETISQRS